MPLSDKVKTIPKARTKATPWAGPCDDGNYGGVTYSMLARFLGCRERFRLRVMEGLASVESFNHRIEYGQMWHTCKEATGNGRDWEKALAAYTAGLHHRYPTQREQVEHWHAVCAVQYPVYLQYWAAHPDEVERTPVLREYVFHVPYQLPSGRTVHLRGKMDGVGLVGRGGRAALYLEEDKTKGDVDEARLRRQLTGDLQTMLYLAALTSDCAEMAELRQGHRVAGVRYDVVRRPLSGGRGTIVRRKGSRNVLPETADAYYARLRGVIDGTGEDAPGPAHFFMRWRAEVGPQDLAKFRRETLDPVLEQLVEWYEAIRWQPKDGPFSPHYNCHDNHGLHWRHPFGLWNVLDEGGATEYDSYLETGDETGLVRGAPLFRELQ